MSANGSFAPEAPVPEGPHFTQTEFAFQRATTAA
jgi:hypothetical protein